LSPPVSRVDEGECVAEVQTGSDEFKLMYEQTQAIVAALKEQLLHSNTKLDELSSVYETTKQSEIEEKNKTKHLERSVRALKIEKDQLFTVSSLFFRLFSLIADQPL